MLVRQACDVTPGDNFIELPGFATGFHTHLKLEGLNPAGSIKMKTAREMVSDAEADGLLYQGVELIESTSGGLGIALATICVPRGYRITLVTDLNTNDRAIKFMRALGANVVVIRKQDSNGGYLQSRIEYIQQRLVADPKLVWLNQYSNPANIAAHDRYTAAEIVEHFGVPDWLFVGVSTSGTLMGCLRHLRARALPTRVVAVDAVGSVLFGGQSGRRWIPGLGASRRPELLVDDDTYRKICIPELETIRMCRRIAREHGLLLGGSTGTVLAAVARYQEEIGFGSRVLAISPDLGGGYLDTIYDDAWVLERFGEDALGPAAGSPATQPPTASR